MIEKLELEFTYSKDTPNHYIFLQKDFNKADRVSVKFYPEKIYVNKKFFKEVPSSVKIIIS